MGTSLHSCVEVREPIELSFGVVSGVGPCIDVLDGDPRDPRGRGCFENFSHLRPIGLNGQSDVFFAQKCIRLVREKLTVFPYGQDIVGFPKI